MAPGQQQLFSSLCKVLLDATPEIVEKQKEEENREIEKKVLLEARVKVNSFKEEQAKITQLEGQMIQLWSPTASLLLLPCEDKYHFFCAVEEDENKKPVYEQDEHLLFLLDISASMNHDEKGVYQAPKSPDHAGTPNILSRIDSALLSLIFLASSIKKARELLVPLVLGALKRNSAVTVVLWTSRLLNSSTGAYLFRIVGTISFFPHDYIDKDTNELWDADALTADIISRTGPAAFTAKGKISRVFTTYFIQAQLVSKQRSNSFRTTQLDCRRNQRASLSGF